jgi:hypothetical protein
MSLSPNVEESMTFVAVIVCVVPLSTTLVTMASIKLVLGLASS